MYKKCCVFKKNSFYSLSYRNKNKHLFWVKKSGNFRLYFRPRFFGETFATSVRSSWHYAVLVTRHFLSIDLDQRFQSRSFIYLNLESNVSWFPNLRRIITQVGFGVTLKLINTLSAVIRKPKDSVCFNETLGLVYSLSGLWHSLVKQVGIFAFALRSMLGHFEIWIYWYFASM